MSTRFTDWIEKEGIDVVAKKVGAHRVSVFDWLKGKTSPRLFLVPKILKLSRGKFNLQDIVDSNKKYKNK